MIRGWIVTRRNPRNSSISYLIGENIGVSTTRMICNDDRQIQLHIIHVRCAYGTAYGRHASIHSLVVIQLFHTQKNWNSLKANYIFIWSPAATPATLNRRKIWFSHTSRPEYCITRSNRSLHSIPYVCMTHSKLNFIIQMPSSIHSWARQLQKKMLRNPIVRGCAFVFLLLQNWFRRLEMPEDDTVMK